MFTCSILDRVSGSGLGTSPTYIRLDAGLEVMLEALGSVVEAKGDNVWTLATSPSSATTRRALLNIKKENMV
jgi:hypothetical protein